MKDIYILTELNQEGDVTGKYVSDNLSEILKKSSDTDLHSAEVCKEIKESFDKLFEKFEVLVARNITDFIYLERINVENVMFSVAEEVDISGYYKYYN